jgi:hypothetical protein
MALSSVVHVDKPAETLLSTYFAEISSTGQSRGGFAQPRLGHAGALGERQPRWAAYDPLGTRVSEHHQRAHFAAASEEVEIVLQAMLSQVRNNTGSLFPLS